MKNELWVNCQDVVGENFMKLSEGNVSEFQKKKASGALLT